MNERIGMHMVGAVLLSACCALFSLARAEAATVEDIVKVYGDGRHNAFTDLVRWRDLYYVCFRNGTSHGSMDGEIRVMQSADMTAWEPCATLDTYGDDRDPHFAATVDRLYVYFGTWDLVHGKGTALPNRGSVRSHVASTADGKRWSTIQGIYEPGWWLWRVRWREGRFYSAAYTAVRPTPSTRETRLLRSDDGVHWTLVSTVTREHAAGEADLWFLPDGTMELLSRTKDNARLFRGNPALTEWRAQATEVPVHSPVSVEWNGRRFIAGRDYRKDHSRTKVWELKQDSLIEIAELPSAGDTGYPGLLVDPASSPETGLVLGVSWYSQHERDAASKDMASVYACRLRVKP